jgi:hypothetical protein
LTAALSQSGHLRYVAQQACLVKCVSSTPEGPQKFAKILAQEQLPAMDRYERRALSRRKFAIRAFDAARRQAANACE